MNGIRLLVWLPRGIMRKDVWKSTFLGSKSTCLFSLDPCKRLHAHIGVDWWQYNQKPRLWGIQSTITARVPQRHKQSCRPSVCLCSAPLHPTHLRVSVFVCVCLLFSCAHAFVQAASLRYFAGCLNRTWAVVVPWASRWVCLHLNCRAVGYAHAREYKLFWYNCSFGESPNAIFEEPHICTEQIHNKTPTASIADSPSNMTQHHNGLCSLFSRVAFWLMLLL